MHSHPRPHHPQPHPHPRPHSDSLTVSNDESSAFIISAIMQKDLSDAKDEIIAAGLGHLIRTTTTSHQGGDEE